MRKITAVPIILFALSLTFAMISDRVAAADTGSVAATVTVQNISVSVADGSVAYGTLAVNSAAGTNALSDTQTATNNGNITATLNIRGQDSGNWTLASTAGSDQYVHRFCISGCTSPPTSYTALTTSYQTLAASVATSGTQTFDLHITTPTTSSVFTEQSVDVVVQAVAP